jgi:hypothetical protein
MKRFLCTLSAGCAVCLLLSIPEVLHAEERDSSRQDTEINQSLSTEAAWKILIEAHDSSLEEGREQKFLKAIRAFEDYLRVSSGNDPKAFRLLIIAHTEVARIYEQKKDRTAWQAQYKQAAEVCERIANMAFSEASRAQALAEALQFYARSGDREKVQDCKERLKLVEDKLPRTKFVIAEPIWRHWEFIPEG